MDPSAESATTNVSAPEGKTDEQELAEAVRDRLMRAVSHLCPQWLQDEREDIVQEAVIRTLQRARRSEGMIHFNSSYLWKTAHSAVVDAVRRRKPGREVAGAEDEPHPPTEEPSPLRASSSRELGRGIRQCLAELVAPRRRAVLLYLLGWSIPQSSAILGWERKRVENLVYRGLASLRRCLDRKGLGP